MTIKGVQEMEGDDMTRLQTVAHAAQTSVGKLVLNLALLALGVALTAICTLMLFSMEGFRATSDLALKTAQTASNRIAALAIAGPVDAGALL